MGYSILLIVTLASGGQFYASGDTIFENKEYCEQRADQAATNILRGNDGEIVKITHGCARVYDL